MTEALPEPPAHFQKDISSLPDNPGENLYKPESFLDEDSLQEKLKQIRARAEIEGETQYQKIAKALKKIRPEQNSIDSATDKGRFGADFKD
jgi:hypothetical protein